MCNACRVWFQVALDNSLARIYSRFHRIYSVSLTIIASLPTAATIDNCWSAMRLLHNATPAKSTSNHFSTFCFLLCFLFILYSSKHSYLDRETSLILKSIAGKPTHLLTKVTFSYTFFFFIFLLHAHTAFLFCFMCKWENPCCQKKKNYFLPGEWK